MEGIRSYVVEIEIAKKYEIASSDTELGGPSSKCIRKLAANA